MLHGAPFIWSRTVVDYKLFNEAMLGRLIGLRTSEVGLPFPFARFSAKRLWFTGHIWSDEKFIVETTPTARRLVGRL